MQVYSINHFEIFIKIAQDILPYYNYYKHTNKYDIKTMAWHTIIIPALEMLLKYWVTDTFTNTSCINAVCQLTYTDREINISCN